MRAGGVTPTPGGYRAQRAAQDGCGAPCEQARVSHFAVFVSCAWRATCSTRCTCSSLSTSRAAGATPSSFRLPEDETRAASDSGTSGAAAAGALRSATTSALASAMSGPCRLVEEPWRKREGGRAVCVLQRGANLTRRARTYRDDFVKARLNEAGCTVHGRRGSRRCRRRRTHRLHARRRHPAGHTPQCGATRKMRDRQRRVAAARLNRRRCRR